ncbi:MAG TPA: molybdopterin-dependent oxidoreductase, partial [Gaiellaceae bacterium]|nr:molybdopterin-dependent oxidoreductase [Gaiellaceae bacterium]
RYRGQKVVVVSPDYAGHTKFADHWLAAQPGSDGALALAMAHVIFREFHVERQVPYFDRYVRQYTDLPCLVVLERRGDAYVAGRMLRASDLAEQSEHAEWKTVVLDEATGEPAVPHGSIGFRWGDEGMGKWNLELGEIQPALSLLERADRLVELDLPRFDVGEGESGSSLRRGVPAVQVGDRLVTTVFDLLAAQLGVRRGELPGDWPDGYDDEKPYTPAWQEAYTGVDRALVTRVAREFARNAERSQGRSLIMMGGGTNHWYHSDQIYRSMLTLVLLCGCQGVNGGGWAHYVGQEKVRPITGWSTVAFAGDWVRPPRWQPTTPYWFLMSDQWRYQRTRAGEFASVLGKGTLRDLHLADCVAMAGRLGWMPMSPGFDRNPLDIADDAQTEGLDPADYAVRELREGRLRFAYEDPDAPQNHPRILTLWRANLLGSSSKGHEYFLRHVLGVEQDGIRNEEAPPDLRTKDVVWRDEAPVGKFDLFTTIDFRMNGSALYSDVVLPAATWYEKYDLSSTDLHPFVHSFNEAVPPPWETRTDHAIFKRIAEEFSRLAEKHLGVRRDLVAASL